MKKSAARRLAGCGRRPTRAWPLLTRGLLIPKKNLDALFVRVLGSNQAAGQLRSFFMTESRSSRASLRMKVAPLFTGQKILVADDSPYYRTVIGLTFTD